MPDDVLVRVEGVSKKFCRSLKKSLWYGMKDMAAEVLGGSTSHDCLRPDEFWAVKDVSFELRRGECLGLIGRNGAGKTTVLKMLNGLIKPDHGHIEMRGRVGALIALGAGFNPILTGRENIYVNGSILGLAKKEIDERLEEIIDFADIREFIDAPVQSYSSGMQVQLGFAVATAIKPDVLLLDEVLAVGDADFQAKCYQRLGNVLTNAAVILVSHQAYHIKKICNRAALLDRGILVDIGTPDEMLAIYSMPAKQQPSTLQLLSEEVIEASFCVVSEQVSYGGQLEAVLTINAARSIECDQAYINIIDSAETVHAQVHVDKKLGTIPLGPAVYSISVGPLFLSRGQFSANLMLFTCSGKKTIVHLRHCFVFHVAGPENLGAHYYPPVNIRGLGETIH